MDLMIRLETELEDDERDAAAVSLERACVAVL
jgi:hypothetical protein